jgi:tetratricopeptide (TPR) repeat protein
LLLGAISLMHSNVLRDFDRARAMLEHLIDRGQRQPLPHAYMAHWWVLRSSQGWSSDPRRDAQAALDCTKRSLENDPDNALALTIDGLVHTNLFQDPESALSRYEAAIQCNPNESLAWLLKGTMHAFKGEGDHAVHDTELALRLSPLDPLKYYYDSLAATAATSAGNYQSAIALAKRSLQRNRTHTSTYRAMAIAQALSGNVDDARKTVEQLLKYEPDFTVSRFIRRSPSSKYAVGQQYAHALRMAGVPE